MSRPRSRLNAKGQTTVPAEIRRKLGIGPGSVVEWEEKGDEVIVRRAGKYSFEDIHRALFPDGPPEPRTIEEMDEAIAEYLAEKHAVERL